MLNAEELLERLFKYYNVVNVAELSKIIGSSQATISNWKIRNSINAIKRKCRELGIYDEIFGSLTKAEVTATYDESQNQMIINVLGSDILKSHLKNNADYKRDEATDFLYIIASKRASENNDFDSLKACLMKYIGM